MKEIEKASIMRIVSDVIRSKALIDFRELDFLEKLQLKYSISQKDEQKAFSMTLQDAVAYLQESQESLRQNFLRDMMSIIMSDNLCSRQENIFLLMLTACFTNKLTENAYVYSVKCHDGVIFDDGQILYIESEFDKTVNTEIVDHYREIVNELRLIGYDFIYLPKVSEYYSHLGKNKLCNLIRFLYPNIDDKQIFLMIDQITSLTTSDFYKRQIAKWFDVQGISEILPSLILKVGSSIVKNQFYSNFLVIVLKDSILQMVQQFCGDFVDLVQPCFISSNYENKWKFLYRGIYKHVFESFIVAKGIRSSVVIDLFHGNILLPEAGIKLEGLHRREKALYALFLLESKNGGVNFKKPTGIKFIQKYNRRMERIQQKYAILYEKFGGVREKAPRLDISTNRLPMIALIKKQIRSLGDLLSDGDDYLIQRNIYGSYYVNIPLELCKFFEASTNTNLPISESDFLQYLAAM